MAKAKILLIDDDRSFLTELSTALRYHGYGVETCSDAEHACSRVLDVKPDAVMLDIKMADKSGFKVAEEIRAQLGKTAIPIIGMTGAFQNKETIKLINQFGFDDCLSKPFFPADAIAKIETALARGGGGSSGMEQDLDQYFSKGTMAG